MTIDWIVVHVFPFFPPLMGGFALGLSLSTHRTWRRIAREALVEADEAADAMNAMRQAHDPGRDVQNRLAAAMEAHMIRTGGPAKPDPAGRRLAAQAFAVDLLETMRRAGLAVVPNDEE